LLEVAAALARLAPETLPAWKLLSSREWELLSDLGLITDVCREFLVTALELCGSRDAEQVAALELEGAQDQLGEALQRISKEEALEDPDLRGRLVAVFPEVLLGFRAMASALTAPQAEHPAVRAACEWLLAAEREGVLVARRGS